MNDARRTVEGFLGALRAGDIDGACSRFHRDVVIREADGLPFGGTRTGPYAFRELVRQIGAAYRLELGDAEVVAEGSRVAVAFPITLTSRATGRSASMGVVDLYTVEHGLITLLDVYYQDTRAVADLTSEPSLADRS